ncbi:MAG: hypothetical protein K0Q83_3478 [Deltaproteobacteria bacterium]|nr:hypothetical protein [Deltaproteobacteria bacterium]
MNLVVLLIAFLITGNVFAQGAPERIRISYSSGGMTSIDLFIARDRKYFQQQNLNGELIRMSANLAISAGIDPFDSARRAFTGYLGNLAPTAVLSRRPPRVQHGQRSQG